jgi:hypothetical protein
MTDITTGEMPAEPVPVLPAPDFAAEAEPAPPEAAPETAVAERALPEVDPAAGALRRMIVDHLADCVEAGAQSVSAILSAMPGVSRNTLESAIRRAFTAGEISRTSPGHYTIAPPRPAEPAKPASSPQPEPVRAIDEMSDADWMDALEAWLVDSSTWNVDVLGPPPDSRDSRIPLPVKVKMNDRLRKRDERRRDREAALARQAAADDELRAELIAGCFGNFMPGPAIDDLTVVKAMLADGVPLDHVLIGLKRAVDRRIDPRAAPIASWRDERFLTKVARCALLEGLLPKLVETWKAAGTAPAKAVERVGDQPAVSAPPDHENAPAPPPPQRDRVPNSDQVSTVDGLIAAYGRTPAASSNLLQSPDLAARKHAAGIVLASRPQSTSAPTANPHSARC